MLAAQGYKQPLKRGFFYGSNLLFSINDEAFVQDPIVLRWPFVVRRDRRKEEKGAAIRTPIDQAKSFPF